MDKGTCASAGCARPAHCRGLCTLHYQRARQSGELRVVQPHRPHQPRGDSCDIAGCPRPVHVRGLCGTHDSARRRNGDPLHSRRAAWAAKYHAHDGFKTCTRCERRKLAADFFVNKQTPDGLLSHCKKCSKAAERRSRAAQPEKYKKRRREYYVANVDKQRRNTREWRLTNLDRAREYDRQYHHKNRDRRREYDKTRAVSRAEQCRGWLTPEKAREYTAKRRARKLNAPTGDPALRAEYVAIIACDPCAYCGRPSEHVDHIQSLLRGGSDAWDNLTPACASCNSSKGTRTLLGHMLLSLPA